MSDEITLKTGLYEELFAPPLLSHLASPEEAWQRYYEYNLSLGVTLDGPKSEAEKPIWYNLAMLYCHQVRLREVIAGSAPNPTETEQALAYLVQSGYRLSLRPLGLEYKNPKTFAPVLTRLEEELWRIGMPDQGRNRLFHASLEKAVEEAQHIYVAWVDEEDGKES